MTTSRTVTQHLASRDNLRQQPPVRLSDEATAKREAWRQQRVELTPPPAVQCVWGEQGRDEDE